VPLGKLPALVCKELADNALDACGRCRVGLLDGENGFFVEDDGPGIPGDDAEVARLFSIRRPLASSKLIRLPTRGMLGNGLRVIAGLVLASRGSLVVSTGGRTLKLMPRDDGETDHELIDTGPGPGTRVEVWLGPELDVDEDDLGLAEDAIAMATSGGPSYSGKTSPHWYDLDGFWELCQASKDRTIRSLLAERFDGCSEPVAGKIAPAGVLARDLERADAARILSAAQGRAKPVRAQRLGHVGNGNLAAMAYHRILGEWNPGGMRIPLVVEVWADPVDKEGDESFDVFINRTRVATDNIAWVQKDGNSRTLILHGCSMLAAIKVGRQSFRVMVNVETPHVQLTSDGKTPDLGPLRDLIEEAVRKVAGKVRRTVRGEKAPCQKDAVLACLADGVARVSGEGKHRFNPRSLFYAVRDLVKKAFEGLREIKWGYFSQIITAHEEDLGHDLPGIARDNRGVLYHPHTGEEIPLGTLSVERYRRPEWTFNKILYSEKESFFEILKDERWPERHDCALLTSKGFASRAARDLLDMLGEADEELHFYCIHDADAAGTMIFQSLQEATRARPKRKVKIINLGLEPREALAMGLEPEPVERKGNHPVARYVTKRWRAWLQTKRVELNKMTTPEFLDWLDRKFADQVGKLVPPAAVLADRLENEVRQNLREGITERLLAEAGIDNLIDQAMAERAEQIKIANATIVEDVTEALEESPQEPWTSPIKEIAAEIADRDPQPHSEAPL
jgi:hypothetical protein